MHRNLKNVKPTLRQCLNSILPVFPLKSEHNTVKVLLISPLVLLFSSLVVYIVTLCRC